MLEHDTKQGYTQEYVGCKVHYKLINTDTIKVGYCTALMDTKMSFITESACNVGLAMVVKIPAKNTNIPTITAFVEVISSCVQDDACFSTVAIIKGFK